MENQRVEKLTTILEELRSSVDDNVASKLDLETCNRIIQRLSSFSSDCVECDQHFIDLEKEIIQLKDKSDTLVEDNFKHQQQKIAAITSHLQNQHNLVTSGYYLSIYMSIGTSLGLVFGLLFGDNIALGLSLGMGIGVAVGVSLDADAKKKGLTL